METKDLNSIGLAYLEMVEKKNTEAKKNHANALHKNQKALDVHSDEDEDHNDDPTDGDGDIDAADLKKLRKDADKDDKKFDKKNDNSYNFNLELFESNVSFKCPAKPSSSIGSLPHAKDERRGSNQEQP